MAKSTYGDQEISTNLLVTMKHLKSEFNIFTQVESNTELYDTITQVYESISTLQRDVFDMMGVQGWYELCADTKENIAKAYRKLAKSQKDLCQ